MVGDDENGEMQPRKPGLRHAAALAAVAAKEPRLEAMTDEELRARTAALRAAATAEPKARAAG